MIDRKRFVIVSDTYLDRKFTTKFISICRCLLGWKGWERSRSCSICKWTDCILDYCIRDWICNGWDNFSGSICRSREKRTSQSQCISNLTLCRCDFFSAHRGLIFFSGMDLANNGSGSRSDALRTPLLTNNVLWSAFYLYFFYVSIDIKGSLRGKQSTIYYSGNSTPQFHN